MAYQNGRGFYGNSVINNNTTLGDLASMNRKDLGFKKFWEGRPELGVGNPADYDWMTIKRPAIKEGEGPMWSRKKKGEEAEKATPDPREPNPYGQSYGPVSQPPPPLGIGQRSGYNVYNQQTMPGSPDGGTVGMNWGHTGQGALPRGIQFAHAMAGNIGMVPGMTTGPRPIAAIGPGPRQLSYPGAIDTTEAGPSKGTFNPRSPGMSRSALGRIRSDLSDL